MEIRVGHPHEMDRIMEIIEYGKQLQRQSGNPNQWRPDYPNPQVIMTDMQRHESYVAVDSHLAKDKPHTAGIVATMCLMHQPEPTYASIDGEWLNHAPYVTVHRIASIQPGGGTALLNYVCQHYDNVRIDTHRDNQQMKRLVTRLGFQYCGVITLSNGDPRDAYHWSKPEIHS